MFRRPFTATVLCALPVLLAGCIVEGHQGGGYPTQPQPQPSYSPPPPAPQYIPGPPARVYAPPPPQVRQPPPPPPKRKLVRTANLTQYCKQRGFTGAGTKRNGQPVCIVTSMGFNTTYTSKVANINYADACRRQFRTSEYHLERGRVNCILYVD